MKLIIKHSLVSSNLRLHIEFSINCLVHDLRKLISHRFSIPLSSVQLTTNHCGVVILLTDFWPLSFFLTSEVAILKLHTLDPQRIESNAPPQQHPLLCRSRCLSPEILPIERLISVCMLGPLQAFAEMLELYAHEVAEEDLLNQELECRWGPLHYACYHGQAEIVGALVAHKANCNKVSIDEWTPLQLSCFFNKIDCVKALIMHHNLQINKMTRFRGTALHLACAQGNLEITVMLLDSSAYINIKDHRNKTPFEYASSPELLEILPKYSGSQHSCNYQEVDSAITSFCSEIYLTHPFSLSDRNIFLYLDINESSLKRYSTKEAYLDNKPAELYTKIVEIQDVVFSESKGQYFFKVITHRASIKYYSRFRELTAEWVDRIRLAAQYSHVHRPGDLRKNTAEAEQDASGEEKGTDVHSTIDADSFVVLEEIGSGSFGTVFKVSEKGTGRIYAMKSLNKSSLQRCNQLKYAISEVKIMRQLKHSFILSLHYAFQTVKYLYLILEYCPNGDLFGILEQYGRLDENVCRFYLAEVILAIEYLHSLDIIYRDLKPANVLVDRYGHAKLADFGMAKEKIDKNHLAMTMVGSPAYLPPEIVMHQGASKASDVYGLGPLLYELLTGTTPFYCDNIQNLFHNIKSGKIEFPSYVSSIAKDLIGEVMQRDPHKRPLISQIKRHDFFRKMDWEALIARRIKPHKFGFIQFDEHEMA